MEFELIYYHQLISSPTLHKCKFLKRPAIDGGSFRVLQSSYQRKGYAMAKILYIEDIQDNITLVEKIVESRGHEFLFANNAEEGLELAFTEKPDLILLDLGLPDADGQTLSVCTEFRQISEPGSTVYQRIRLMPGLLTCPIRL